MLDRDRNAPCLYRADRPAKCRKLLLHEAFVRGIRRRKMREQALDLDSRQCPDLRSQLTESAQRKVEYGLPVNLKVVMAQAEATGTPEAVQQFSDLLNSVGFAENNSDNQLRQIILENGLLYCQGSKSLDETIKLIQSKASLYLAEHYN